MQENTEQLARIEAKLDKILTIFDRANGPERLMNMITGRETTESVEKKRKEAFLELFNTLQRASAAKKTNYSFPIHFQDHDCPWVPVSCLANRLKQRACFGVKLTGELTVERNIAFFLRKLEKEGVVELADAADLRTPEQAAEIHVFRGAPLLRLRDTAPAPRKRTVELIAQTVADDDEKTEFRPAVWKSKKV